MNAALTLSARSIGASFASDPELRLPHLPRFPAEVIVLPFGTSGLLFEGVHGTQVLNGRAARGFIPLLLPKLDGTRDLDGLAREFPGVAPSSLRDAIALLFSRGLLEDGVGPSCDPALEDVAAFAGRYVDVTRVNRNRGEALARLATRRVAVLGDGAIAEAVLAALFGQGLAAIGHVHTLDDLSVLPDLVIAAFAGDRTDARAQMLSAHRRALTVLHLHVGADSVEIGPLFIPGKSGCHACLRTLRERPVGDPDPDMLGFFAGVAALQAFHVLGRVGRPNLYNSCHVHRRSTDGPAYEEVRIARLPGCAECGLADCRPAPHERNGHVWLLHNAANGLPPRELLSPRDYQMHYAPANLRITREVPEPYYGAVPLALPQGRPADAPPVWLGGRAADGTSLDLETLATLLRVAVGYQHTAEGMRRITPSGGGLGSAQMFVIARGVRDLDNGVYHYCAHEHRLDRLRDVDASHLAGALGISQRELPPLVLVGVGWLDKLQQKYGNFAFRFSNLDGGFARVALYEALDAYGMEYLEYADARDRVLMHLMGVPGVGSRNLVTFVAGIGRPAGTADVSSVDAHQYVDRLIDLAAKRDRPDARPQAHQTGESGVPPPAGTASHSLQQLLLDRRSVRDFAPRALPAAVMRHVGAVANGADAWFERISGVELRMQLWAVVTRGDEELPVGIHQWDAVAATWKLRRTGVAPAELDAAMLQGMLARAPVVLFVTGDFGHAVAAHGGRGFRDLLGRAGAIAARALLAATAHGACGCPWGGLSEDGWGPLLGIDRYTECPLFGVSLGYAHGR